MISILYILIFCFVIYKSPFLHQEFGNTWKAVAIFLLKILAGLFVFWLYTYYYPDRSKADIYRYYDDSQGLYQLFFENPQSFFLNFFGLANDFDYNGLYFERMNNWVYPDSRILHDNRLIIRINTVLRFLCGKDFFAHFVWFNFLAFIGGNLMLKSIRKIELPINIKILSMYLIPSFWVWSSGLLKEPLIIFALGIIFYQISTFNTINLKIILMTIFAFVILFITKSYLLMCIIPALLYILVQKSFKISNLKSLLVTQIPLILFVILSPNFISLNIFDIVYTKRLIFISVANAENSGSYIDNILLEPNFYNFALNLPKVLMNVFIKPFPTDARSIPELMYSLENVFFLILSFYALILFFKRKFNFDILKNNNLMIPVLIFGIYLFLIIGYTTPVYGAITRYKCIVLPYYLVFLLSQFNWGLILKKKTR